MFFFDSHGTMWGTVPPADVGAMAFGPTGTAREASEWAEVIFDLPPGGTETAYAAAKRLGRLDESGEWPVLR